MNIKRLSSKILLFLLPTTRRKGVCDFRKNFVYLRRRRLWGKSRDKNWLPEKWDRKKLLTLSKGSKQKVIYCLFHVFIRASYDFPRSLLTKGLRVKPSFQPFMSTALNSQYFASKGGSFKGLLTSIGKRICEKVIWLKQTDLLIQSQHTKFLWKKDESLWNYQNRKHYNLKRCFVLTWWAFLFT